MKFDNFTFIVTDDCNFDCSYCNQHKEKKYMQSGTIEKAVDFFYPYFTKKVSIYFYGGEPLLAFDQIQHAVSLIEDQNKKGKKEIQYALTTNGSLIDDGILDFFNHYQFKMMLSFDGLSQESSRQKHSTRNCLEIIKYMQSPRYRAIDFSICSVFTPDTVKKLSESICSIIDLSGGVDIQLSLDESRPWNDEAIRALGTEMRLLTDYLEAYYRRVKKIPISDFHPSTSQDENICFQCGAAQGLIAISSEEDLWGCIQFYDYLKHKRSSNQFNAYWLGKLKDFTKNHEAIMRRGRENYSCLKQDNFFTEKQHCFLCPDVLHCGICPVYVAYGTSYVGRIPSWVCSTRRITRAWRENFLLRINYKTNSNYEENGGYYESRFEIEEH